VANLLSLNYGLLRTKICHAKKFGKALRSGYSKVYSKALEYEYRVKTAAFGTLKRYSIFSLTLYIE
jgi:hypothetical protein